MAFDGPGGSLFGKNRFMSRKECLKNEHVDKWGGGGVTETAGIRGVRDKHREQEPAIHSEEYRENE